MQELITSLSEEVKPTLSSVADFLSNSEFSWVLIAALGPLVWKPVRYAINSWRLHRRRQKYPHMIVCSPRKKRFENTLSTVLMSAVCFVPFMLGQFLLLLFGASVSLIIRLASLPYEIAKIRSQQVRLLGQPQQTSAPRQPPKPVPPSVLRRPSASSPRASYHRVVFIEHSNGSVKTENYYYNPKTGPIDSVPVVHSVTPDKTRMMQTPQKNAKRIQRIQTPPPRQASKIRRIPIILDDKENEAQVINTTGPLAATKPKPTNDYNRNMVPYQAPMATTSLSDCMRKRRIEEDSDLGLGGGGKRHNRGRISLGTLTHRKRVLSSRAVLSQQEREEREQRIWKEMNRKRQKPTPKPAPIPSSAPTAAPTDAAKPTASFGNTLASAPVATPAPADASKAAVSFGSAPAAAPATVPAPSDASKPSFSFGGAPAPVAALTQTAENPQNTAAPSTPAPSAGFSFGGTPAPASQPGPAAQPAPVPASFSFGSTAPAPVPAAPVPQPAFGGVPAPASASGGFGAAPAQTPVASFESAPSGGFDAPAPAPGGFGAPPVPASGGFGAAPAPTPGGFGSAPAPTPGGFGAAPVPASGGFGAAPAPTLGGFGSAPAPAPGGFGAAPAPTSGGFGSTPAPASGGFGSAPAVAPGGFGSAPAVAFGSAPAPAPGGFGAAPAPTPGGFGAPPSAGGFGAASIPGGFGGAPSAPAFGAVVPPASMSGASARRRAKKGSGRRH